MLPKDVLWTLLPFLSILATGKAFLLPLLFPVSIKISIHSNHKHPPPPPPPKPDYHFVPVYKEVVVKGHHKDSYGDGSKYGTSYGDGHVKVYTNEPHVKQHKYAEGYGSGSHYPSAGYPDHHKGSDYHDDKSTLIEGSLHISTGHHKGSPLQIKIRTHKGPRYEDPHHFKGTPVVDDHYKGTPVLDGHYKGTPVVDGHYKGTPLIDGHYKGTPGVDGHYTGTPLEDGHQHYQGGEYVEVQDGHYQTEDQHYSQKPYNYIKSVGGYKLSDYLPTKQPQYEDQYVSHVAVPQKVAPGHTYADIQAAHQASHSPKAYDAKQYEDLGDYQQQQDKYNDESYLDDSLPAYKYGPTAYADRSGKSAPRSTEPTSYAGFGTSVYGDSYAKITYEPKRKNLKVSLRAYKN